MSKHPVPSMPAVPCARPARHLHTVHRDGPARRTDPIVITPQQVLFGTAAAAPLPRPRLALLRHIASAPSRVVFRRHRRTLVRHYPPPRMTFMEQAAMSREMDRL